MLFNSYEFIFAVLPASVLGYFLLGARSARAAIWWLVVVSIFFYAWWRPANLPLFLGSIVLNFAAGRYLNCSGSHRKSVLSAAVGGNLALLAVFKYADFTVGNLNALFGSHLPLPGFVLPLGISFFTFTQITYLVDTYRRRGAGHPLREYALFVSFYPHLLAGPILHHQEMLPQFADPRNSRPRLDHLWRGLCLFGVGLSKKVLLADNLAPFARFGFDTAPSLGFLEAWLTTLAYCFQIYFDFSGYTDMAIGIALLFNIRLPFNFDSPYRALDIQAFWRRWHITLGRFFRDYVYIPIGGSRGTLGRTLVNLFAVALLSGLWHGASWSFVVWGAMHGAAMVIFHLWKRAGLRLARPLVWLVMFLFINVSWVFFRAPTWDRVGMMFDGLLGRSGIVLFSQLEPILGPLKSLGIEFRPLGILKVEELLAWLAVSFVVALWPHNSNALLDETRPVSSLRIAAIAALTALSVLHLNQLSEFIYFNF